MADVGTLLSAVQTLFAALQCSELKELYSSFTYKKELEKLQGTVGTIRAVLEDAESKQVEFELSKQAMLWIEELKDALYDADDLVDEFVTLAKKKKLKQDGNLSQKVKGLFSRFNSPAFAWKMSKGINEIRERLENISSTHNKYGFKLDCARIRKRRKDTCSYVDEQDIIGRDDDLKRIVDRLLDPGVACLSIVGIGGLGKTTLAQLVYNHPTIKQEFPFRWWTCVSDEGRWELKVVLSKIFESVTGHRNENPSMDHLQKELREELVGKKYLLVLDDMWSEDRDQWLELMTFFKGSLGGSSILVTTRSRRTGAIVGGEIYDLKGLSDEDSWVLFEKTAFAEDHEVTNRPELEQIGREIVKKCSNVPLAVRVVGTALYAQGKPVWLSFRDVALVRTKQGQDDIQAILKRSYLNLDPQLKICFSYCALFPKDYNIRKELLLQLWIAQGYVIPHDGQNIEDAVEEYFLTLLRRCFFQDVKRDRFSGEVTSFKMHDLMHDIAQEVAGEEVPKYNSLESSLNDKIRHLMHLDEGSGTKGIFKGTKIRTYLRISHSHLESPKALGFFLDNWISLRALNLMLSQMRSLPSTIGKLLHLRYLDLSGNRMLEVLPNSITKLHNLQFLSIAGCVKLKQLPKDLGKLTNLRVLDTERCPSLTHMPRGVGQLSCLWKLPWFVVAEGTSGKETVRLAHCVEELKALLNLKGSLYIDIKVSMNGKYVMGNGRERVCLSPHLTHVHIQFPEDMSDIKREIRDIKREIYEFEEALLDDLQPHPNLRQLQLTFYCGRRMPNWAMFLPNLVSIELWSCHKLRHIGEVGKLVALKSLQLDGLDDLEFMEDTRMSMNTTSGGGGGVKSQRPFFPSLEKLVLSELPKLKGWWREESNSNQIDDDGGLILPSFPCLTKFYVYICPNLTSMPLCPTVEKLKLYDCNVNLQIMESVESGNSKLRSLLIGNVGHLKFGMPLEAFQCLSRLSIVSDDEVEKLSEVEETFRTCSSSLRELIIDRCPELKSVSGGLEHLTALKELELWNLPNLNLHKGGEGEEDTNDDDDDDDDDDDGGMPWRSLQHSLHSLKLGSLPQMVKLPNGMRHLTNLQILDIRFCKNLEAMPEWMPELTSLNTLDVQYCSGTLEERCCKDKGVDWPKIQHIPKLRMVFNRFESYRTWNLVVGG